MKDYYRLLGVTQNASQEEIKGAFRKLAFQCHPDTAKCDKKEAEARFKEINEAYGVLCDETKRRQYDAARRGDFVGAGYNPGGFTYSQQDIFRDIYSNRAMYEDIAKMFAQAGLRFDQSFYDRVFFGRGVVFQFYAGPQGFSRQVHRYGDQPGQEPVPAEAITYKPGWAERTLSKAMGKLGKIAIEQLLGVELESFGPAAPEHVELKVSAKEAAKGGERDIKYKVGRKTKKLRVKIPAGIKTGTNIHLSGVGPDKRGEIYLHVQVKE